MNLNEESIHYTNFIPVIKKRTMDDWQHYWTTTSKTTGGRLNLIQEHVSTTSWFERIKMSKKITNCISRLRIGHGLFPTYMRKIKIADSDLCRCGAIGNIDHIIIQCPNNKYQEEFWPNLSGHIPLPTNSAQILRHSSVEVYKMLGSFIETNHIIV